VTLIAFWKKKEPSHASKPERIIPLPNLTPTTFEPRQATSTESVQKARETLKVLKLERQILGSAVTTIYEAHSKGEISEVERDRMLEKYKVDLKRLESGIADNQKIVDLYDLEVERNEIIKGFNAKLEEIDAKLRGLKSNSPTPQIPRPTDKPQNTPQPADSNKNQDGAGQPNNKVAQGISDSEKRIEQIREEILKAMDRLEQIETEG
jgi:hypothetical protein